MANLLAHVQRSVPPVRGRRPEVPEALAAVLDRMLAKQPDQRFATPAEVAAALEPLARDSNLRGLIERAEQVAPSADPLAVPSTGTMPLASSAVVGTQPAVTAPALPAPSAAPRRWQR
jgi:hypothetical protein